MLKFLPGSGTAVCNFNLATKDYKKNTHWHNVTAFGKTAENCANYLKKGSKVSVKGEIANNNYEKDGVKQYGYVINAERVEFLDSKGKSENQSPLNTEFGKTFEPVGLDTGGFQALDDDDCPF